MTTISVASSPANTAAQLAKARAEHAAAIQRHQEAISQATRAAERHQAVASRRQRLMNDVTAGKSLIGGELARARTALTTPNPAYPQELQTCPRAHGTDRSRGHSVGSSGGSSRDAAERP